MNQISCLIFVNCFPLLNVRNLNNYFNFHVCLSICPFVCPSIHVFKNQLQFLQFYHKMSLIKGARYLLREKNMHSGSPSDSWCPRDEAKLSCFHQYTLQCVVPNQMYALAHLGCTRKAGIFQFNILIYQNGHIEKTF